jgi:arsenate reductase-like glutaredoxin family protein
MIKICNNYNENPPKPRKKSFIFNLKSILQSNDDNMESLISLGKNKLNQLSKDLSDQMSDGLVDSIWHSLACIHRLLGVK